MTPAELVAELERERQAAEVEDARSVTIDPTRLRRAIWLDVKPVAPDRYLVTGGADGHVVVVDGGWVRCDCLDFSIYGDGCKHALACRPHGGDPTVVVALRQLVPRPSRAVRAA